MSASSNPIQQVGEFMSTFGQPVRTEPKTGLRMEEAMLRLNLIGEELGELAEAFGMKLEIAIQRKAGLTVDVDPIAALDALTDLRYVVYGAYHTLGLAEVADLAFNEVHSSNMSKGIRCPQCEGQRQIHRTMETLEDCPTCKGHGVIAIFNETGKIIKPSTYCKPELHKLFPA